jgi:hypothetical protein
MRNQLIAAALTSLSLGSAAICCAEEPASDPTLAHDQAKAVGAAVKQDAKAMADAAKHGAKQVAATAQAVAHEVALATKEGAQQVAATAQHGAEKAKAAVNGNKTPAPAKPAQNTTNP